MDLSRLPGRHFVDDDEQANEHSERRERGLPAHPQLPPRFSSSGSVASSELTKYSPNADPEEKDYASPGLYGSAPGAQLHAGGHRERQGPGASIRRQQQQQAYDQQAGLLNSSRVAFAASPDASRPPAFPTLSYGAAGAAGGPSQHQQQYTNVHPGIGQQRPSFLQADSNAEGGFSGADFKRKKSLVRPERERLDPDHRLYNYRQHAALSGAVAASNTGYAPHADLAGMPYGSGQGGISALGLQPGQAGQQTGLRRGKSILAREEGMANESGLSFLKRGATLRGRKKKEQYGPGSEELLKDRAEKAKAAQAKAPLGPWMIYCYIVTALLPGFVLKACGLATLDRRRAFREKLGLLSIIALLMAAVGFLTFGFTDAVCGNQALRFHAGSIEGGSMIFHGYDYAMDRFAHPAAAGVEANSNPLYSDWNAGSKDGSFMFQNVNGQCKGLITRTAGATSPPADAQGNLGWYFPCNIFDQYGTTPVNQTGYAAGTLCHTQNSARIQFQRSRYESVNGMQWQGPVYYTWDNITNSTRNLGVYKSSVLDFSLLNWLDRQYVNYPAIFDELRTGNSTYEGRDSTMQLLIAGNRTLAECMDETIRVGFVDSKSIGCVVADIVLYVSLVFILAVVGIKFGMAVIFSWFFGRKMGAFKKETQQERQKRIDEVEKWTKDIYKPAPAKYRPNVKNARKSYLPTTSRFTAQAPRPYSTIDPSKRQSTMGSKGLLGAGMKGSPPDSPLRSSKSNSSLPLSNFNFGKDGHSRSSSFEMLDTLGRPCPFPLFNVNPQPAPDFQPYGFSLAHTILLVTAYSESVEGLRTTLDSLATSDYPNSHKLILVIADGMVKGSGNDLATPDIVLGMMKDLVVPREEVEPHSYVAVADGHKRHNMAKVYAGWYDYDDETVEGSKQQRVPMILVAKCGNPLEAHDAKPGNRGKRDSQIVLMAFLQKVMFDERMTAFEYEFFNAIWKVAGISADNYEHILMVDADTKVFPDSVTRMVGCMAQDVDIMGLCGETKIANKSETWVTMIQVFEYYISHHQTKAFESMWGGVTCLPGCFSMYRIKAPKGGDGYWVPILANPDIVEHYSENVVDTLHKKNLLLLGEDRYLTTLMLKTFPKRKMMFCPQAYCKTVVPDTFRVLLSQRRRWINSTIHNLFELLLVRDLCGTFCFSMQFVVFMELVGTLVLPAAIAFTIYILFITCLPRSVTGKDKPIIPLILLACILGLPGILIIVTSRKVAYVGWMAIYLLSLPIWNAVLPLYAYFHMDDFSWGSTRKVEGEAKDAAHGDKEGEFDSQAISMKRWSEWERERRWKNGTRSRDSTFDVLQQRSGSPQQYSTNRTSIISSADTFVSQGNPQDPFLRGVTSPAGYTSPNAGSPRGVRNVQELQLPAPLSATPPMQYPQVPQHAEVYDAGDPNGLHSYEASPYQSGSSENFHSSSNSGGAAARQDDDYPRYAADQAFDDEAAEREAILRSSPSSPQTGDAGQAFSPTLQQGVEQPRERARSSVAQPVPQAQPRQPSSSRQSRGVSLYDPGPVSAPDGAVRYVQRNRRSSAATRGRPSLDTATTLGNYPASPISPQDPSLPPGAAPRQ